jgi:hypothetical protein
MNVDYESGESCGLGSNVEYMWLNGKNMKNVSSDCVLVDINTIDGKKIVPEMIDGELLTRTKI